MNINFEGSLPEIQKQIDDSWKLCRAPEDIDILNSAQLILNIMKSRGIEETLELLKGVEGFTISNY